MTAPAPALAADLEGGLRRLRLGAMRRLAPELLVTAKTQRWSPEEFLRTLVEAEIASRDESNVRGRLKAAGFPVTKTIDELGIDLHRRRSVVVVLNDDGDRVSWSRIDNTPANLAAEIVAAGDGAEVAMEACWGWYWAADVIAECGAELHLAHPLGIAGYGNRRVKNDLRDATLLADLLRLGRLPEAWVAPPEVRELREAVRYRAKLSRLRSGLKQQVHQTLGKEGVIPELDSIWRAGGQRWLDELRLGDVYVDRIESLRDLIELYDREIRQCDARIHRRLKGHPGYEAIQALRGVGPVLAAVFVAEIGDVGRFDNPRRLCSWAGLTPRLRESDAHSHRGHITKQGSRLLRWAAVEAVSGAVRDPRIASIKGRVGARRGRNIGRVAAARHLLTLVYYGLRDGEIRCLATDTA